MAKRPGPPARTRTVPADVVADLFDAMHRGVSIRAFARNIGIPENTLRLWVSQHADAAQYARAREAQAHAVVDELEDVARGALGGTSEEVQARRLLVDALKWRASKLLPRTYGDRTEVEHGGSVKVKLEYTDDDE